jgi:TfoX/Sxy family transcriptional regulator of competence genes
MASSRPVVDYVVSQLGRDALAKPMFGEYGLYFKGTLIGLICDDRLFIKVTDAGVEVIGDHERGAPYPGAKPAIVVPQATWKKTALMERLAEATAAALASAKPKPKAKAKPKAAAKPARRK